MKQPSPYMSELTINHIFKDFAVQLKNERTKVNYFSIICYICDYAKTDLIQLSVNQAQEYFNSLLHGTGKRLSIKTIHSRLYALRSIYSFLIEHKNDYELPYSFHNIFDKVNIPEMNPSIKSEDIPSMEEMDRLLEVTKNDFMMYLILSLVFRCSLSASEVCNLKMKQLGKDRRERNFIVFHDKKKERYVKLPEDIMSLLNGYLATLSDQKEYLFYNKRDNVLKVRNLESLMKKYVIAAKLSKEFTIQDIRNASIAYMLASGAETQDVAKYAGVDVQWMYRYNDVITELDLQPVDLVNIQIKHL